MTGERVETAGEWSIQGTWLVEDAGHHTCGTGPEGHYGAHEPGCGYEPLVNLATLDGYSDLIADAYAQGGRDALTAAADEIGRQPLPARTGLPAMLRADWLRARAAQIGADR